MTDNLLSGNSIVIDLEATCNDKPRLPPDRMEIIEIGACFVDKQGRVLDQFQTFVKPSLPSPLTPFCMQLTSIAQADVDGAPGFVEAIAAFEAWRAQCVARFGAVEFWGSWGGFDRNQFERNARLIKASNPRFLVEIEHRNLKVLYAQAVGLEGKGIGLGKALNCEGIRFVGTKHRAIDDALNIAPLVPVCLGVTESRWRDRPSKNAQRQAQ